MPPYSRCLAADYELLSSTPLEIITDIGSFFIHRDILKAQSKPLFFNAGIYKDPSPRIDLSKWDSDTVGRLVQFLYIGNYKVLEPISDDEGSVGTVMGGMDTPDTVQSLASHQGWRFKDAEVDILLAHAELYTLAERIGVEALQEMALTRLKEELEGINGLSMTGTPIAAPAFIEVLEYVYEHIYSRTGLKEPMRDLVSTFAAENIEHLVGWGDMVSLLGKGDDLVLELMEKVAKRVDRDSGMNREICDLKEEIEVWKKRDAASNVNIQRLGIINAERLQQVESENEWRLQALMIAHQAKIQELEGRFQSLKAINEENLRELEAAKGEGWEARLDDFDSHYDKRMNILESRLDSIEEGAL